MKFRTEFEAIPSTKPLNPEKPLLMLGSCFTDNIGERIARTGWDVAVNPCGTMFNPQSIGMTLYNAFASEGVQCAEVDGRYFSWDFPTRFSADTAEECLVKCGAALDAVRDYMAKSQALIVTFGTAWVYALADDPSRIVANCHKMPERMFVRRRLTVDEIVEGWLPMIDFLRTKNSELRFIFTVSPVRHLKDGFNGNATSKSTLLLACERLAAECEYAEYFPSYEIVCDDLRDYRFYAEDLVHPSTSAVDYIWEKFVATYIAPRDLDHLRQGEAAWRRAHHRPLRS